MKIPVFGAFCASGANFSKIFIPDARHPEAKNLNAGKLNKLNQPP
jgi:hypothetical protein